MRQSENRANIKWQNWGCRKAARMTGIGILADIGRIVWRWALLSVIGYFALAGYFASATGYPFWLAGDIVTAYYGSAIGTLALVLGFIWWGGWKIGVKIYRNRKRVADTSNDNPSNG